MKILIEGTEPQDILREVSNWLRRAAAGERAFGAVACAKVSARARSEYAAIHEYAAIQIERLADSIDDMDVVIRVEDGGAKP